MTHWGCFVHVCVCNVRFRERFPRPPWAAGRTAAGCRLVLAGAGWCRGWPQAADGGVAGCHIRSVHIVVYRRAIARPRDVASRQASPPPAHHRRRPCTVFRLPVYLFKRFICNSVYVVRCNQLQYFHELPPPHAITRCRHNNRRIREKLCTPSGDSLITTFYGY